MVDHGENSALLHVKSKGITIETLSNSYPNSRCYCYVVLNEVFVVFCITRGVAQLSHPILRSRVNLEAHRQLVHLLQPVFSQVRNLVAIATSTEHDFIQTGLQ